MKIELIALVCLLSLVAAREQYGTADAGVGMLTSYRYQPDDPDDDTTQNVLMLSLRTGEAAEAPEVAVAYRAWERHRLMAGPGEGWGGIAAGFGMYVRDVVEYCEQNGQPGYQYHLCGDQCDPFMWLWRWQEAHWEDVEIGVEGPHEYHFAHMHEHQHMWQFRCRAGQEAHEIIDGEEVGPFAYKCNLIINVTLFRNFSIGWCHNDSRMIAMRVNFAANDFDTDVDDEITCDELCDDSTCDCEVTFDEDGSGFRWKKFVTVEDGGDFPVIAEMVNKDVTDINPPDDIRNTKREMVFSFEVSADDGDVFEWDPVFYVDGALLEGSASGLGVSLVLLFLSLLLAVLA